jgi:hypothetical protein
MPTVTLQDGESVEHDKVSFEQGLVVAYVVDEDGPPHVDDSEAVAVYPTTSVLAVDIDDDEHLGEVDTNLPDEYVIE